MIWFLFMHTACLFLNIIFFFLVSFFVSFSTILFVDLYESFGACLMYQRCTISVCTVGGIFVMLVQFVLCGCAAVAILGQTRLGVVTNMNLTANMCSFGHGWVEILHATVANCMSWKFSFIFVSAGNGVAPVLGRNEKIGNYVSIYFE